MNNFEREDFMVVPIQDPVKFNKIPNYNGHAVQWSKEKNWVSWQEREDFYPNCNDWYVIPPNYAKYSKSGMEIGFYIIDVDNHEGDRYKEAIAELKTWNLPPTLAVRTASGGLHLYYWTFADALPQVRNDRNGSGLPIEIKVHTGWVAPNGRDRVIIRDLPIAPLHVMAGTKFGEFAAYKKQYQGPKIRRPINPDYQLPEIPSYPESQRHDNILKDIKKLQDDGCPPDLVEDYVMQVVENSPGSRRITEREIRDMIDWEGSGESYQVLIERDNENSLKELLEPDPLEGAEELPVLESLMAQAVFATEEEKVILRKKYLEALNDNRPH